MSRRLAGPLISAIVVGGIALVLYLNLETGGRREIMPVDRVVSTSPDSSRTGPVEDPAAAPVPAGFREYPIGEEVSRNYLSIRAVYLPPIAMADMPSQDHEALLHLEADVAAVAGNPNGFARDAFVPYLRVDYRIEPTAGGRPIESGTMIPMVAQDGLHYGANVMMPKPGTFRLVYTIHPPDATLGRHSDPATGVAPWWAPFEATFEWDYPGPPPPAG